MTSSTQIQRSSAAPSWVGLGGSGEYSWREIDYGLESEKETDLLREVLSGFLDIDAAARNVGGQALVIRNVGREIHLEAQLPADSDRTTALRLALAHYRPVKSVRQVFAWQDGEWLQLRAIVDPWTRNSRRAVYKAERSIDKSASNCDIYFEARPRGQTADLPSHAKLLFAREAGAATASG